MTRNTIRPNRWRFVVGLSIILVLVEGCGVRDLSGVQPAHTTTPQATLASQPSSASFTPQATIPESSSPTIAVSVIAPIQENLSTPTIINAAPSTFVMVLISLRGPVEAVLTDPAGHRLGVDPRTQQRYEEIDGAQYYPDQNNYRTFLLSEPQLGATYRLDLYATGTGSYELMCLFGDMQGQTFLPVPQGKVSAGQHIQQTITVPLRSQDVPQPPDVFRMQVPDVALIGQPVSMSAEVDEPNPGDSTSLSWDFGDGSQMTGTLTPTHSFAAAGTYTITLHATDSIGFFGHSSRPIEVLNSSTLGVVIRHRAILYEGVRYGWMHSVLMPLGKR